MSTDIALNKAADRYEITVDGTVAGFTEAHEKDGVVTMPHTVIEEEFGGQGLAGKLVAAALTDVRGKGQKVKPVCTYVASFIDKHPEYQDLLA